MAKLRRLASALGPQSDYSFDKTFKPGAGTRAGRRRHARTITKMARRAEQRDAQRDIAAEL